MGALRLCFILIQIFLGTHSWGHDTANVDRAASKLGPPQIGQQRCRNLYDLHKCADFFKENPELGEYAVDCNHPSDPMAELKSCATGAWEAADEIRKLIGQFFEGPPEEQKQYYAECVKITDCKIEEFTAAAGREPGDNTRRQLEQLNDGEKFRTLIQQLQSQTASINRYKSLQASRLQSGSEERDAKGRALWAAGLSTGEKILKKAACYRSDIQGEAVCHGLATLAIPGAGLKVGSRLYKIAQILERGTMARETLGRALSWEQKIALQAAHEEENLRRKTEILRDGVGLAKDDRRKIIEAGVAGDVAPATAAQIQSAAQNLSLLEKEGLIESNQLSRLSDRLAICGYGPSRDCDGAVKAVQQQYERSIASFRKSVHELEERLRTKIEAGDESPALMDHWNRISDCAKTERPVACGELIASTRQLLGDAPAAKTTATKTPTVRPATPIQAIQNLNFLTMQERNKFREMLLSRHNQSAINRANDTTRLSPHFYQPIDLAKTVEQLIGRNPKMGLDQSKAYLESADGQFRVLFDPIQPYITIKYKNPEGKWLLSQRLSRGDGTLRMTTPRERVAPSNQELWIRMTHFSY